LERYHHENDIKHTLCKVGRPQSNGKIERFFQTYDKHRWRLGTVSEFLAFYNEERPHMSLDWDNLETPAEAFDRLLLPPADDLDDPLATEVSIDD
jgi:putative transposase